jgi:hypothetical protein
LVIVDGDQLFSQATGQEGPDIHGVGTKFFIKVVDAEIEFFKGGRGAVTHLMRHQGAGAIKAPRKSSRAGIERPQCYMMPAYELC